MSELGRRLVATPDSPNRDSNAIWGLILRAVGDDLRPHGVLAQFTPTIQQLHAMYLVDGQVQNGGFNQLLFNTGDVWFARAIEGFERAGLFDHRDVVIAVREPAAAETAMREAARSAGTLEAFAATYEETDLGEFDDRWYALPDIYESLDRFVLDQAADIWEST